MSGEKKPNDFLLLCFVILRLKKNLNHKILVKAIGVLCRELLQLF